MIRHVLALRLDLNPSRSPRALLLESAQAGARGVVLDAGGELSPDRLSESGRRQLRHLLKTTELSLVALGLPTRRSFDTLEQLDDRLRRIDRAFALAFDLGSPLALIRAGKVPEESDLDRRAIFADTLRELGRRAEHRGVVLALETGDESATDLRKFLDSLDQPHLAASVDPSAFLRQGIDPASAVRALGPRVTHAYLTDSAGPARPVRNQLGGSGGHASGVLDWEEYLGALEEVEYRGPLTVWPDPTDDPIARFQEIVRRSTRF